MPKRSPLVLVLTEFPLQSTQNYMPFFNVTARITAWKQMGGSHETNKQRCTREMSKCLGGARASHHVPIFGCWIFSAICESWTRNGSVSLADRQQVCGICGAASRLYAAQCCPWLSCCLYCLYEYYLRNHRCPYRVDAQGSNSLSDALRSHSCSIPSSATNTSATGRYIQLYLAHGHWSP